MASPAPVILPKLGQHGIGAIEPKPISHILTKEGMKAHAGFMILFAS
jgi:hypothetical protein